MTLDELDEKEDEDWDDDGLIEKLRYDAIQCNIYIFHTFHIVMINQIDRALNKLHTKWYTKLFILVDPFLRNRVTKSSFQYLFKNDLKRL